MTTYFVNINRSVNNVRVYTIKKSIRQKSNKISDIVESLIQKYLLKSKTGDAK